MRALTRGSGRARYVFLEIKIFNINDFVIYDIYCYTFKYVIDKLVMKLKYQLIRNINLMDQTVFSKRASKRICKS